MDPSTAALPPPPPLQKFTLPSAYVAYFLSHNIFQD